MTHVALVTGGTRGIGEAISIALSDMGMKVAANYVGNDARAAEFTERTGVRSYKWNIADFDECQAGVEKVVQDLGPINVLVNNAGITRDANILKMTPENWRKVIDVNLSGCFNMCKLVFAEMKKAGYGRIVNISSLNGQIGQFGQANYAAAKSGMLGLTKTLAQEGARAGVTVNAIAPGYIETEMSTAMSPEVLQKMVARIPVSRLGQPSEVARGVVFLCAEDAGFITGTVLSINGGQLMF